MIGALLVVMALAFGEFGFAVLAIIPNSLLGVLLVFAGIELCPLVRNLKGNRVSKRLMVGFLRNQPGAYLIRGSLPQN